jgi:serine/threonine protein kinase
MCGTSGMTRVVKGLDSGDLAFKDVPLGKLFFIVFEMAEGDVRKFMNANGDGQLSWRFKVLKDMALGLNQLHQRRVYHQDLKPSNVLVFESGQVSKLGDLGRAHCSTLSAPHDNFRRPGAFHYAPPEQIYDHHFEDPLLYRDAGDLYLLGSMLDFFVTQKPTTVRLIEFLNPVHQPFVLQSNGWRGHFKDVLPYLQAAYARAVSDFSAKVRVLVGDSKPALGLAEEIACLYRYSTDPDPMHRGHPKARFMHHQSDYDLQRFVSAFEILSKKVAMLEKAANA